MPKLLLYVFVTLLLGLSAQAQVYTGRVSRVKDGDTFVFNVFADSAIFDIRLACIDAPEKRQILGKESARYLESLLAGREVTVTFMGKDRYGRRIARASVESVDVGYLMVKNGYAWYYEQYCQEYTIYQDAQHEAQDKMQNLWAMIDPLEPWIYRKLKRSEKKKYEPPNR